MHHMSRKSRVFDNLKKVAMATPKVANHRHASAIVYRNRIISYGINSYKSSPFQKRFSANEHHIFLHAEIACIKNCLRNLAVDDLKHCSLYVCRTRQDGSFGMSKPCGGCQMAIAEFGLKNVYYTDEYGGFIAL